VARYATAYAFVISFLSGATSPVVQAHAGTSFRSFDPPPVKYEVSPGGFSPSRTKLETISV
jgi:hypothetical protein